MTHLNRFLAEHIEVSRRYFLKTGAAGITALSASPLAAGDPDRDPVLRDAIERLESFLTLQEEFRDVSRSPFSHKFSDEKKREVGLTREGWSLEVTSDPDNPARIKSPLTSKQGTALDFNALMQLASQHAVRFGKVMTCLNIGCPLGTGIWEGIPLREVLWLTEPQTNSPRNLPRRIVYYGYHEEPKQLFRSSLPASRVFEDPFDLPPVILCYKLNDQWLSSERGGPVRVVVPEAYGFKSIKWVTHVMLSNLAHANDTYADANNDVDSPLKSFAATLSVPKQVKPSAPIPITGYAQIGISGLSKVQVWLHRKGDPEPKGRFFADAPWQDAEILPPPVRWGGGLTDDEIPRPTIGFESSTGEPKNWPMRLFKVHWAVLMPGVPAGDYTFRCRTVDEKGHGQPMPRPFRKSGHAAIEEVSVKVEA